MRVLGQAFLCFDQRSETLFLALDETLLHGSFRDPDARDLGSTSQAKREGFTTEGLQDTNEKVCVACIKYVK